MDRFPFVRRVAIILALAACVPRSGAAQRPLEVLRPALESRIEQHRGTVGVAVLDLETNDTLSIRGDHSFPSASLIKLPILVELFQQVENETLRLDDPIMLIDAEQQPGSGILQFLSTPHRLTIRDAAVLMIAVSDNTATNLLIDKVGVRSVNRRMDALGLTRTRLYRKTWLPETSIEPDSSARYGLGVVTPREMTRLLAHIDRGTAVSPEASRTMLEMLGRQVYAAGIPRRLPDDVEVAHKTGDLAAARHDCGIVRSEARDFALCVMTRNNADRSWRVDSPAHRLIGDIARRVHDHFTASTE